MGNKAVRHDSQSHCFYGGEKLAIEWLPDGEVLIVDPQTWDPDLAFVLAWWQRESCWYDDASIAWELNVINHNIDDVELRHTVNVRLHAVAVAQAAFYELLEDRTGWRPSHPATLLSAMRQIMARSTVHWIALTGGVASPHFIDRRKVRVY